MNEEFVEFQKIVRNITDKMIDELGYSAKTVSNYRTAWRKIWKFMRENQILQFSREASRLFILKETGKVSISECSYQEAYCYRASNMLLEYLETGRISVPKGQKKNNYTFNGKIGYRIQMFFDYSLNEKLRAYSTVRNYEPHLHDFNNYCIKMNLDDLKDIDLVFILEYISQTKHNGSFSMHSRISSLRVFLRYAYETKLIKNDLAKKIPSYKLVRQSKLPSVFSKKEINLMIESIDRSTTTGKRNYAIVLLAARLGLRASDIVRLKFENINWESNCITLNQVKTGNELVLPLLPEVGNAIYYYLKHARPNFDSRNIFLTVTPPYGRPLSPNRVGGIVRSAFIKSGVNTENRKCGSHSLRHSLGSRMLEEKTTLNVISEVLGHKSSESTRYYLRIDLESMKQCMLEVPEVPGEFYEQKGGVFYG